MQRIILPVFCALTLSSCQSTPPVTPLVGDMLTEPLYNSGFSPSRHNVRLSSYVEQLVLAMQQSAPANLTGTVAIASFVDFNTSLEQTHALGNQLAENFLTQLRNFGYTVTDIKANNMIRVTESGDFVFSRKLRQLAHSKNLNSVLSGTLIYTPQGIEVNTRIISMTDQNVISAATTTIPYFVVRHLGQVQ